MALENGHQDEDPFLVTGKVKTPPTKLGMVKAFRRIAVATGMTEVEAQGITRHALRPTEPQFMASTRSNLQMGRRNHLEVLERSTP